MRLLTSYQFRQKAGRKHGLRYIYDLVVYQGSKSKVTIICPVHGEFQQIAADHLRGYGCNQCRTRQVLPNTTGELGGSDGGSAGGSSGTGSGGAGSTGGVTGGSSSG